MSSHYTFPESKTGFRQGKTDVFLHTDNNSIDTK